LTAAERTPTACAINLETPPHFACLSRPEQCPVCGGDNQCRLAKGHLSRDLAGAKESLCCVESLANSCPIVCSRYACAGPVLRGLRGFIGKRVIQRRWRKTSISTICRLEPVSRHHHRFPRKHRFNGANRTQAGSLCYITPSRRHPAVRKPM
jgi:hypothetical protein